MSQYPLRIAFLLFSLFISGCKTPQVPPEVKEAETQEHELWRAGAPLYALEDYNSYKQAFRKAKDSLIKEKAKFAWFRDYKAVKVEFRSILDRGEEILKRVQDQKNLKSKSLINQTSILKKRFTALKKITFCINESQLIRKSLAQAEVALAEADFLLLKEEYSSVEKKLSGVNTFVNQAEEAVFSILERYTDEKQIKEWKKWVNDTISESRRKGIIAIVVSKLDRKLILYKRGEAFATYEIGLGRYGLSAKLYAGDDATPEGRYQIIRKVSSSRYHKALLINYPNEEDRKKFEAAKKRGLLPRAVGIGGMIEIHGGGKDSLTNGCISVENEVMDRIFDLVGVGTPLTIVGAVDSENSILAAIRNL